MPACEELKGLTVTLDKLVHHQDPATMGAGEHAFIYFLTISNLSQKRVTLLGRKWLLHKINGETLVIEGDKIVGKTPTLAPGEQFSYNSFHITDINLRAEGSFFGIDEKLQPIMTRIPAFDLIIPTQNSNT